LQMVFDAEVNPSNDGVVHARHQHGVSGIGHDLPYPAKQDRRICGVPQLLT
jgi:hypothetical protein